MIGRNSYYKAQDVLNEGFRERMVNYFNPFGYNFESNLRDLGNTDLKKMKSENHENRKSTKK